MENVQNEVNVMPNLSFNSDRFFSILKSRLVTNLNYNNQAAEELAKKITDRFDAAFSKETV